MRLDSRRISSDIGRLSPMQTTVRFWSFKGPSCKRDLTQGAVMRQYAVPQAGKFHVIGLAEAAVTSHLPLGHGPSVSIEKMKNFNVIGDQLQGTVRIIIVGWGVALPAEIAVFGFSQIHPPIPADQGAHTLIIADSSRRNRNITQIIQMGSSFILHWMPAAWSSGCVGAFAPAWAVFFPVLPYRRSARQRWPVCAQETLSAQSCPDPGSSPQHRQRNSSILILSSGS